MPAIRRQLCLEFPKTYISDECNSIMRKTVHEWLEVNKNGTGMAKKKTARRKSLKTRASSISHVELSLQRRQRRKTGINKHPK